MNISFKSICIFIYFISILYTEAVAYHVLNLRDFSICKTFLWGNDVSNPSFLSVDIQGIKDGIIPVGSTFDVTWKTNSNIPSRKNLYEFIVFTMPHSVRFNNGKGFLMLPPEVKLPFGFKFAQDKMRVLFPLYLPHGQKTQGSFKIRPLIAGNFTLKWAYVIVNECGDIVFLSKAKSQLMTFEVQEQKPVIVVQDRVGMEKPEDIFLSPSKEYELRVFKDRFQVFYTDTGELILEKAGTKPNFSPGSRFLGYISDESGKDMLEVVDLLSQDHILKSFGFSVLAWGKNDSFLILGFTVYGTIHAVSPFLDKNLIFEQESLFPGLWGGGCHACSWETSQIAIDLENALIHLDGNISDIQHNSLISEDYYDFIWNYDKFKDLGLPVVRCCYPYMRKLDKQFEITHIHDEVRGRLSLFSDPLLGKKRIYYLNIAKIMSDSNIIRGNRGRVLRFNSKSQVNSISNKIVDRLYATNLSLQNNSFVSEQTAWLSIEYEYEYSEDGMLSKKEMKKDIIGQINKEYSNISGLSYENIKNNMPCYSDFWGHNINGIKYHYWKISGNKELLLMQADCDDSGASKFIGDGELFIFSVINNKTTTVRLSDALLQRFGNKELASNYFNLAGAGYDMEPYRMSSKIEAFLSENVLLISSLYNSSVIVFDITKQKVKAAFGNIPEAQDLESLHLSQDGRLVVQINKGGRFYFYDIATQKRILNGIYIDDEIVLYTEEGFYDATPEGAHYITWYYPGLKQHFNFSQFESKFKRPDIIKSILTGQKVEKPNIQLLPPPSVDMVLKHPGNYARQATVELSATSISPISNMRLFIDGAPVAEIPVTGKQAQKTVPLELKRGKHWITAVAYNDQGYSSIPKSLMIDASAVKAKRGNLYMLGVGVNNYPNMPTANLDYAKQDIIAFAETARANPATQYENINIKQLFDEKATPTNIYQALTSIVQQATIDDTLMLYFSGHGEKGEDGKFYFLTSQASFGNFESTGLAWEKVAALLAQTKGKVIVFLDACHSGVASQETVVPNDEYVAELMKIGKAGMVVMAASKGRQFSFEDSQFGGGHGAFNYAITQALIEDRQTTDLNQNGIIELTELYHSVKFQVHKLTEGKQTPWLSRNEIIGEMPVL